MANVLITGCSSGFGLLTALHFARQGDKVFATLRDPAKGGELQRACRAESLELEILELDLLDSDSVDAAAKRAETAGPLDVLVNNAGMEVRGPIEETEEDEVRLQFDTNVFGTLRVIRAILPGMRERRAGTIVTVSSIAGLVSRPFGGLYAASKHALEAITEALYHELKPFGVRLVLIAPGRYATQFAQNMLVARRFTPWSPYRATCDRFDQALDRLLPDGKPADPEEVAELIYRATYDPQKRFRYLAGADAEMMARLYREKSFEEFEQLMRQALDWQD